MALTAFHREGVCGVDPLLPVPHPERIGEDMPPGNWQTSEKKNTSSGNGKHLIQPVRQPVLRLNVRQVMCQNRGEKPVLDKIAADNQHIAMPAHLPAATPLMHEPAPRSGDGRWRTARDALERALKALLLAGDRRPPPLTAPPSTT